MLSGNDIELVDIAESKASDLFDTIEYNRDTITSQYLVAILDSIRTALVKVIERLPRSQRKLAITYRNSLALNDTQSNLLSSLYAILDSLFNFLYLDINRQYKNTILVDLHNLLINTIMMQQECEWNSLDTIENDVTKIRRALETLNIHANYASENEKLFHEKWIDGLVSTPSTARVLQWTRIIEDAKYAAIEGNFSIISAQIHAMLGASTHNSVTRIIDTESTAERIIYLPKLTCTSIRELFTIKTESGSRDTVKFNVTKSSSINLRKPIIFESEAVRKGIKHLNHQIDHLLSLKDALAILTPRNIRILFFDMLVDHLIAIARSRHVEINNDYKAEPWDTKVISLSKYIYNRHIKQIESMLQKVKYFVDDQFQAIKDFCDIDTVTVMQLMQDGFSYPIKKMSDRIPDNFKTQPTSTNNLKSRSIITPFSYIEDDEGFIDAIKQSGLVTLDQELELTLFKQKTKYNNEIFRALSVIFPQWKDIQSEARAFEVRNTALMNTAPSEQIYLKIRNIVATISSPIYVNVFADKIDKHQSLLCILNFLRCHLSKIQLKDKSYLKIKISDKNSKADIHRYLDYFFLLLATYRMKLWKTILQPALGKISLSGQSYDEDLITFKLLYSARITLDDNGLIKLEFAHTQTFRDYYTLGKPRYGRFYVEIKHLCDIVGMEIQGIPNDHSQLLLSSETSKFLMSLGLHFNKNYCKLALQQMHRVQLFMKNYPIIAGRHQKQTTATLLKYTL